MSYNEEDWLTLTGLSRFHSRKQELFMVDALAHIPKPRVKKTPTDPSAVVPVQEVQDAIRKDFPCEGQLKVRHLWSIDGFSRFRANWFCEEEGKTIIVKSLFLCVMRTDNGLVVKDETVVR